MRQERPRGWRRPRQRPAGRLLAGAILSLAAHALLLVVLSALGAFAPPPAPPLEVVGLAPLTASDWNANRAIAGEAPKPLVKPPAPPPPKEEPAEVVGPVVEVPRAKEDPSVPKVHPEGETVFLADRDSYAKKNTVSRHADVRYRDNNLAAPQEGRLGKQGPVAVGEGGDAEKTKPGKDGTEGQSGTGADRLALPDQAKEPLVALAPGGDEPGGQRRGAERIPGSGDQLGLPGAPGENRDASRSAGVLDPRLRPSLESLERIAGGPMMSIEGVEEDEATLLNTREFKYSTFYTRLYRAVADQWQPSVERAYLQRDPDGTTYGPKRWRTALDIKLHGDGSVKELRVVSRSGLDFLDREALNAVRSAAPFPNPPPALVKNGEIDLGMWTFTFDTANGFRRPFGIRP